LMTMRWPSSMISNSPLKRTLFVTCTSIFR
jgi:hypothetical protein